MNRLVCILRTKKAAAVLTAVCAVMCLTAVISAFLPNSSAFTAKAENNIKYTVYYRENEFFKNPKMPQGQSYLMSFTDFIELENTFSARFSEETDGVYKYSATETLLIKNAAHSNQSGGNAVVYEQKTVIAELSGAFAGDGVFWTGDASEGSTPSGIYTVTLQKYADVYRHFSEVQNQNFQTVNPKGRPPNFTAELILEFSYTLDVFGETVTRGCVIPLSDEVYSVSFTGPPDFEFEKTAGTMGLFKAAPIVLFLVLNVLGCAVGVRKLLTDDEFSAELRKILKKYSDEIIITSHPADLSEYKTVALPDFRELLKLAVISEKYIRCYHDGKRAEFCVLDGEAYCFRMSQNPEEIEKSETIRGKSEFINA